MLRGSNPPIILMYIRCTSTLAPEMYKIARHACCSIWYIYELYCPFSPDFWFQQTSKFKHPFQPHILLTLRCLVILLRQHLYSKCLRNALVGCYPRAGQNLADTSSALADPNLTEWLLCPSTPAAILFTVLFALTTATHLAQAIYYKKTYCVVIVFSTFAQIINYICRIVSIKNPNSLPPYAAWFVIILVSGSSLA